MPSSLSAEELSDLFSKVEKESQLLEKELNNLEDIIDITLKSNIYFKAAFRVSTEFLRGMALDYIQSEMMKAMIMTGEFNYPPFINRMQSALSYNYSNANSGLLSIIPNAETNTVEINLNFDCLGHLDEYANAVTKARTARQKDRKSPAPPINLASRMWREKIYAAGREGGPVSRRKYNRKSKSYESIDVTSHYKSAYENTIRARLNSISGTKAPFWYLIEHGNFSVSMASDLGGNPYPTFGATNVRSKTLSALYEIYSTALNYNRELVQKRIDSIIASTPITGGHGDIEEIVYEVPKIAKERIDKVIETGKVGDYRTVSAKVFEINGILVMAETYYIKEKSYARYRGPGGRFISVK